MTKKLMELEKWTDGFYTMLLPASLEYIGNNSIVINKEVKFVKMLGLKTGTVRVEEYNSKWKCEFLKEEAMLKEELHAYDVNIQHVGSTSIVGCCAKPIIDMSMVQAKDQL